MASTAIYCIFHLPSEYLESGDDIAQVYSYGRQNNRWYYVMDYRDLVRECKKRGWNYPDRNDDRPFTSPVDGAFPIIDNSFTTSPNKY